MVNTFVMVKRFARLRCNDAKSHYLCMCVFVSVMMKVLPFVLHYVVVNSLDELHKSLVFP